MSPDVFTAPSSTWSDCSPILKKTCRKCRKGARYRGSRQNLDVSRRKFSLSGSPQRIRKSFPLHGFRPLLLKLCPSKSSKKPPSHKCGKNAKFLRPSGLQSGRVVESTKIVVKFQGQPSPIHAPRTPLVTSGGTQQPQSRGKGD